MGGFRGKWVVCLFFLQDEFSWKEIGVYEKNPRNHDHGRTCNYFFLRKVFLYWEGYFFGNNLKNMFRRNERFEFRHFLATRVYRDLEREGWAFQTAPSIWGVSDPSFIFFSSFLLPFFFPNLLQIWQLWRFQSGNCFFCFLPAEKHDLLRKWTCNSLQILLALRR